MVQSYEDYKENGKKTKIPDGPHCLGKNIPGDGISTKISPDVSVALALVAAKAV